MSWVPAVSEEQAGPAVKPVYKFLQDNWDSFPTTFWLWALSHNSQDQVNLFTHVMFASYQNSSEKDEPE